MLAHVHKYDSQRFEYFEGTDIFVYGILGALQRFDADIAILLEMTPVEDLNSVECPQHAQRTVRLMALSLLIGPVFDFH